MAQEMTPKITNVSDSALPDGKVRPKSKVQVLFTNSKHHGAPYKLSMLHPALAAKLVEQGKCIYHTGSLSKEQLAANKEAAKKAVMDKGRLPGKAASTQTNNDEEFEDIVGGAAAAGKHPKK